MTQSDIKNQLKATIAACQSAAASGGEVTFFKNFNDKWSIGENLIHLSKSAKSVNRVLSLPKEQLANFGKPMQPSRDYATIFNNYQKALAAGATAARGGFDAQYTEGDTFADTLTRFAAHHEDLVACLDNFNEEDLDNYQIPHPVLGNLTVREMYYFMDLHINHHQKAVDRILNCI